MPRNLTDGEKNFKWRMSQTYKAQEQDETGCDDWGEFIAFAGNMYQTEIYRLRNLLMRNDIQPGPWDDPLPRD